MILSDTQCEGFCFVSIKYFNGLNGRPWTSQFGLLGLGYAVIDPQEVSFGIA